MDADELVAALSALVAGFLVSALVYTFSGPWATLLMLLVVALTASSLYRGQGEALYSLAAACLMMFADMFVHEGGHYVMMLLSGYHPVIGLFGVSTTMVEVNGSELRLIGLDEIPVPQAVAISLAGPMVGLMFLYMLNYVFDVPVGGIAALELSNLFPFPVRYGDAAVALSDGSKVAWLLGVNLPALPPWLYWSLLVATTLAMAVALSALDAERQG